MEGCLPLRSGLVQARPAVPWRGSTLPLPRRQPAASAVPPALAGVLATGKRLFSRRSFSARPAVGNVSDGTQGHSPLCQLPGARNGTGPVIDLTFRGDQHADVPGPTAGGGCVWGMRPSCSIDRQRDVIEEGAPAAWRTPPLTIHVGGGWLCLAFVVRFLGPGTERARLPWGCPDSGTSLRPVVRQEEHSQRPITVRSAPGLHSARRCRFGPARIASRPRRRLRSRLGAAVPATTLPAGTSPVAPAGGWDRVV